MAENAPKYALRERLQEGESPIRHHARLALPTPLLKAGSYEVRFGMGIARVRSVHSPEEALRLDIVESTSDTSHVSYSKNRIGQLVVPLEWQTRLVE